ncbi:3585_t:CDS:1, partial [Acaulospora morrowiae]
EYCGGGGKCPTQGKNFPTLIVATTRFKSFFGYKNANVVFHKSKNP